MTKFLLLSFVAAFLFQTEVLAQVGLKARYKITVGDAKLQQSYEEVLEILEWQKSTLSFLIQKTEVRVGSKNVSRFYRTTQDNLKRLSAVFADCESLSGVYEDIVLFGQAKSACALPVHAELEEGITWYGETPFGVLKKKVLIPGTKVLRTRELIEVLNP